MTLLELQKILGDRINITLRTDLTTEEREVENAQSSLIFADMLHNITQIGGDTE